MARTVRSGRDGDRRLDALPIDLTARGAHAGEIRRWVESIAGWQAVEGESAILVPPQLAVADVPGADPSRRGVPLVLLVASDDDPVESATAAGGADAVLRWPEDREQLADVAETLSSPSLDGHPHRELRVAGCAGGVGTTTVCLALAGLLAWAGGTVLVVVHGSVPVPDVPRRDVPDLLSAGTWDGAGVVPGVPRTRIVVTEGPAGDAPVDAGPAGWVVRDVGTSVDSDVLVVRPDRAGLAAMASTVAPIVVVVGEGPAPDRALRGVASGRRVVRLPYSARVARAGFVQRVPASLPGAWLRRLRPALTGWHR